MSSENSFEDPTPSSTPMPWEDSIATRRTLLDRLKDKDDQASWQEFFDTYWSLIFRVAKKSGLSDEEAQDIVQETVISVARKIDGFVYDPKVCSFKTWMLRLTRWRIINQLKRRQRKSARMHRSNMNADDPTRTATVNRIPDPASLDLEPCWDREWALNLYRASLERTKQKVSPDQYQIYDLCVAEDMPARKVAKTLGVSIARVYLAKHRVGKVHKHEIEKLRKEAGEDSQ